MIKKLLIIGIFSLFIFSASFCLAIDGPTGLTPCGGITVPITPLLNWEDVSGVHHYEVYYKQITDTYWKHGYPAISEYQVFLEPQKNYEWYAVSCADEDCNDSAVSNPALCFFTTEEIFVPPDGGNGDNNGVSVGLLNPLEADNLIDALKILTNLLFVLAMVLAPILIIYAAILIITAAGDATKISKARQIILWTLVAVAIILFAKGFPSVIKGAFGG